MLQLFTYWVYDASPLWSLGWDLIFVRWRKKTHLRRCYFHFPTYVVFLLESTRKGHLIPCAVIYSIRRSCIFHSKFFSLKNPCPSDKRRAAIRLSYPFRGHKLMLYVTIKFGYKNVMQSALFFAYKNVTQSVWIFVLYV